MTGWESTYRLEESKLKNKSDLIIVVAHWILIHKKDFVCLGTGSEFTLKKDEEDSGSELLPDGWQNEETLYSLRYLKDNKLYILMGIKSDEMFVLNFLDATTQFTSSYTIDLNQKVTACKGPITEIIPNHVELIEDLMNKLIETAITNKAIENPVPVARRQPPAPINQPVPNFRDPLRVGPSHQPRNPFAYGENDLDPLSGGGGMIFNPRGQQPLIRFDPMNPYGRGDPNNDIFMPPRFDNGSYRRGGGGSGFDPMGGGFGSFGGNNGYGSFF